MPFSSPQKPPKPTKAVRWSVRRVRVGPASAPIQLIFKFPTSDGMTSELSVPASELRHPKRLLDKFADFMPAYPAKAGVRDQDRMNFITGLVNDASSPVQIVPDRTGFIDKDTFATRTEILRSDGSRVPIPQLEGASEGRSSFRGALQGTVVNVLEPAEHSSYLAFGIGVALAAPLPTYLKLRSSETDDPLMTETAVYNFSGTSSSGKTTVSKASMSLVRSPDDGGTFDFSARGLAELASDCTDTLMVLDDTENVDDSAALVKALKGVVHTVPGGRSKAISRGVDQTRFPQLRWSTMGLTSSPKSIISLAAENGWTLTWGHKVRLFNIAVPGPDKGGIFDRLPGSAAKRAKKSVKLIAQVERGYTNNYGHLFPEWLLFLLKKDRSSKVLALVQTFIKRVGAQSHGWENRFARKFGIVYAAFKLGVQSGLLPWPKDLPLKVVKKCYRKARRTAQTDKELKRDAPKTLATLIAKPRRTVLVSKSLPKTPTHVTSKTVALRFVDQGIAKLGLLDGALQRELGSKKAKELFVAGLRDAKLLAKGHGHAGTVQNRLPIKLDGRVISKPRLWMLDLVALQARAQQQTGNRDRGSLRHKK